MKRVGLCLFCVGRRAGGGGAQSGGGEEQAGAVRNQVGLSVEVLGDVRGQRHPETSWRQGMEPTVTMAPFKEGRFCYAGLSFC